MKVGDYDTRGLPQNQLDFNDDTRIILNFGKFQHQVLTSPPTWRARRGEAVYVFSGTTGAFYICTTDNSTTWKIGFSFTL